MRFFSAFVAVTALSHCAGAVAVPDKGDVALQSRSQDEPRDGHSEDLWKRKGGGGGGGRGGGSSSGGSSGSSGSSGSGSSGSSSGSSGAGRGSSSSNSGGSTTTGSGTRPAFGSGGSFYGGGARTPFAAGRSSPSGIVPGLFIGSALGFWGAYWLVGAWHYPYAHPYTYHNSTSDKNETKPVECLCRQDLECGCDDNSSDSTYMNGLIGNGSYDALNKTLVNVANVNGTDTIFINGTLANGTTAAGGTEDPNMASGMAVGWWPVALTALALAFVA